VESQLRFLGLLILENKLKDASAEVIHTLNSCDIRTIMATGDNVLTAISVARQCKLIDYKKPVYLGEKVTDDQGKSTVEWRSSQENIPTAASVHPKSYTQDRFSSKVDSNMSKSKENIIGQSDAAFIPWKWDQEDV